MSSADQREVGVEDLIRRALPGVRALSPYEPGKPISELEREYGVRDIIKLASNESPLGASPAARAAAAEALAELALYPDGNGYELKQALARRQRLDPLCLTLGNGSNDLLELISRVFLAPGRNAVYSQYAFAIYALVTQAAGAEGRCVAAHPLTHPQPLGHDLAAMAAQVDADTAVVFLANPNNPTGTWFDRAEFERFMQAVPPQTLVVLDEAYFEYVEAPQYPNGRDYLADHPNLIVIRTFSKAYGLAALRVGYAMSHPASPICSTGSGSRSTSIRWRSRQHWRRWRMRRIWRGRWRSTGKGCGSWHRGWMIWGSSGYPRWPTSSRCAYRRRARSTRRCCGPGSSCGRWRVIACRIICESPWACPSRTRAC